jgi:menaquinol-cytochrome c reductase iron-sulfur subunit
MENVQTAQGRESGGISRRNFYVGAICGLGTLITGALAVPALLYLFAPPRSRKRQEWVEIADATKLAVDSPVEIAFRRNRTDGWKIISEKNTAWVVKRADNSVVAYGPQCTHLGCAYHWEDDKKEFLCPCHTSLFSIEGKVLAGPAPRPLDRYDTKIEGNKLLVGQLRPAAERQG